MWFWVDSALALIRLNWLVDSCLALLRCLLSIVVWLCGEIRCGDAVWIVTVSKVGFAD